MQQKLLLATKDTTSGNTYILLRMETWPFDVVLVHVSGKPRQASLKKGAELSAKGFSSTSPYSNPHSKVQGQHLRTAFPSSSKELGLKLFQIELNGQD